MRRLAGSRPGATSTLSVVLALGAVPGLAAPAQAAAPTAAASSPTSAERSGAVDPELHRVGAARARAAAEVELPRPVRGAHALRLLGEELDEAAARNDLSEAGLTELLTTDRSAWLDVAGAVFFKDEAALAPASDPVSAQAPLDQTFLLHSKAGSTRTIYLDFDGGTASATAWHVSYPATPTTQPAWDLDGNPAVFNDAERTAIQTVWAAVAEDYAPFDVDVTTADPGAAGIFRSSAADTAFGSHVLITPSAAAHDAICGGCGGVAYINVFDTVNGNGNGAAGDGYGYMQPAWVFPQQLGNSPKNIAEAVSHEVGHNFGLRHDGNATQGYDSGHGAWAPIMGVGYYSAISQWSKGNYSGANNQQDDVAIIRGVAGPRTDEAPTAIAGAAAVPIGTAYVTGRTDVDTYLLGRCTGATTVDATALATLADLDIQLSVLDATGQVVATADPTSAQTSVSTASGLNASLSRTLTAGTYYARVDGVGNGDWSTGYDDYGSLGAYTLTSSGCDGAAPTGTPSAPTNAAATPHASDPTATVTWAAPTSAGSSAVTGYLLSRSGDDASVQVGPTTTSYAWTGLAPSTSYTFSVTALNANGPGASVTASATTAAGTVKPSAPQSVTGSWDSLSQRARLFWSAPASSGSYPVSGYDIYLDAVYLGRTTGTGVAISQVAPGAHTLGVAAVSQAGTGTLANVSVLVPTRAANDAFAQRTTLSGVTGSVSGDNTESSAETGEPAPPALRASAGNASVWYSWTAPASGPATLGTDSPTSGRDTTLAVYTGTSVGALTQVAGNDDQGASRLSSVSFTATAGTTYAVAVNGYRTLAAGVGPFTLAWTGTAPAIATTTTLTATGGTQTVGLSAGVTVAEGAATGTVDFREGGSSVGSASVTGGSASVDLTGVTTGQHTYTATFVPTGTVHAGSTSAPQTVTVTAPATPPPTSDPTPDPTTTPDPTPPLTAPVMSASTTRVTAPRKAKVGSRPVIKVSVLRGSAAASGSVVVTVGTRSKTLTLTSGSAKLKLARVRAGKVKVVVRYLGDPTTSASKATWTIRVPG